MISQTNQAPLLRDTQNREARQCGTAPKPRGRGLVVTNMGGRLGWLARRLFPKLSTRTYLLYVRAASAGRVAKRIGKFLSPEGPMWFSHLELETLNRCNGACAFCPVNRQADTRAYKRMEEALFARIVRQLREIGYSGYLGLFSNNEPLLDTRLESFAAEARKELPDAYLNLSTNGTLLDVDRFRALIRHFDHIVVNNYRDRPEMFEHIRAVHDFCLTEEGKALTAGKTLEISLRCATDVLSNRAGKAPNRAATDKPPAIPCVLPFNQMVVRPDGGVSLCCNDALGQITLGDLNGQTLSEVWFGEPYATMRTLMAEKGRGSLPLCRVCDFVKHTIH